MKRFGIEIGSYFKHHHGLGISKSFIVVKVRKGHVTIYEPVEKTLKTITMKEYRRWSHSQPLFIFDEAHLFLSPVADPEGYKHQLEEKAAQIHRGLFLLLTVRKGWDMPTQFDGMGLAADLIPLPARVSNPVTDVIDHGYRRCRSFEAHQSLE